MVFSCPEHTIFSGFIIRFRTEAKDIALPLFLNYLLRSDTYRELLPRIASGTTITNLSQGTLASLPVSLPSLPKQRAIAHILGSLDDKIELNQQMNETLEAIARAIFKSWFVDFDPVRDKMNGQKPYGMDDHTAALFPDSFVDSPIGKIPLGWKVHALPEVIEVNPKRILKKGALAPYLDMANMPTNGPYPATWADREMGSGTKFVNGDTLVARITPCLENGKTAYVDFLPDKAVGWGSTEYIVLRPKESIPLQFAYLLARSDDFRSFAIQQMTGSSGRQRVPATSLESFCIAIPTFDSGIFQALGNFLAPIFNYMKQTMLENRILANMRDALLPKLISGEIRVPEAEAVIGMAV
ncbi:type I restriction enzyme, S subunit [Desulfatibacillum alkenivorans DSM 16219]|uniref:Type I restriction enzyme, S subunit n=2 Tax=Desulfatibacillum alkenivorans TaxID=259354 RepID=A0A1M6ZCM5_9BACT|nr:type I restriction enzyme, S subunit [Desulfatibacillum alkenivorans DSM 16219]